MKKTITLSIAAVSALALMSFGVLSSGGKTNRTGGHGETGCTCHAAALSTSVTVNVTSSGTLFTAGYVAGTTYTISVAISETAQTLFGFDFEALNAANTSVGTLTAGAAGDDKVSGTAPVNMVHNGNNGLGTGTYTYSFTWLAPAASTGAVTFWYSGLAANNNGTNDSGDHWNKGSKVVSPASGVGIAEHAIVNNNLSVFPNPVSESANVSYELAENSTVSATLINVTGQVVTTFFNKEEQTAGKQNRKLEMEPSIAKGIYFVAINVNGKNSYKKIVVE